MKTVSQLDENGYFVGTTTADESPLEQGVFLIPARCVEVELPAVPVGTKAKFVSGEWAFEAIPVPPPVPEPVPPAPLTYQEKRKAAYPPMADYLDAVVKADPVATQAYVDACLAVKLQYPKITI